MSGRGNYKTKEAESLPRSADEISCVLDYLGRSPDFAWVLRDEAQTWRWHLEMCGFAGDLIEAIPAMRATYQVW